MQISIKIKDKEFTIPIVFPSSYLPRLFRTAVRFSVVGGLGVFIQTWFFTTSMSVFNLDPDVKSGVLYFVAFTLGYIFEMIPNYLLSNWYTFGTRPQWKNAGGFVLARIINFPIQVFLLPVFNNLLPTWSNEHTSYLVIFIAGIVNYFICLFFFKSKKK